MWRQTGSKAETKRLASLAATHRGLPPPRARRHGLLCPPSPRPPGPRGAEAVLSLPLALAWRVFAKRST